MLVFFAMSYYGIINQPRQPLDTQRKEKSDRSDSPNPSTWWEEEEGVVSLNSMKTSKQKQASKQGEQWEAESGERRVARKKRASSKKKV